MATGTEGRSAAGRARALSARARLLLLIVPCVSLLLVLDSWRDYDSLRTTLNRSYDETLLEPVFTLAASVHAAPQGGFGVQLLDVEALQGPRIQVQASVRRQGPGGPAGPELALVGPDDLPAAPADAQTRSVPAGIAGPSASRLLLYDAEYQHMPVRIALLQRTIRDQAGRAWLLQARALEPADRRARVLRAALRRELVQDSALLALTALLVSLGIAWSLAPLKRLQASVLARSARDLRPLDARMVPAEVVPLVHAINSHLAQERQLLESQRQFLADASHQLRTPLAILMTQAGYALREQDPALSREALRAIVAQLARSRRLSDQLLSLAEADRPVADGAPAPRTGLSAVARELVLEYLPLARDKGQDLGWSPPPDGGEAWVLAPESDLREALANLLHNAIRNTPEGGAITMSAWVQSGRAIAQVCDDGPGIAPAQREQVFERFFTTALGEGAGLGLSIARALARRNQGEIVLADGERSAGPGRPGLCARLELPACG